MRGISFALLVAGLNADTRGPESEIVFKLSTSDIDDTAVAANLARISGLGVPEVRELRAVLRVRRNRSSPHFYSVPCSTPYLVADPLSLSRAPCSGSSAQQAALRSATRPGGSINGGSPRLKARGCLLMRFVFSKHSQRSSRAAYALITR